MALDVTANTLVSRVNNTTIQRPTNGNINVYADVNAPDFNLVGSNRADFFHTTTTASNTSSIITSGEGTDFHYVGFREGIKNSVVHVQSTGTDYVSIKVNENDQWKRLDQGNVSIFYDDVDKNYVVVPIEVVMGGRLSWNTLSETHFNRPDRFVAGGAVNIDQMMQTGNWSGLFNIGG